MALKEITIRQVKNGFIIDYTTWNYTSGQMVFKNSNELLAWLNILLDSEESKEDE